MKRTHRKTQQGTDSELKTLLLSAIKTLAITLIAASLATLCAAAVLCSTPDPVLGVSAAAYVCLTAACVIGGFAAWLVYRERAVETATLSGVMLVLILLTVSLATGGMQRPVYTLFGYAAAVLVHFLIASAATKFLGNKKRKRRHY